MKKSSYTLVIVFFICTSLFSQNKVDTLLTQLSGMSDSTIAQRLTDSADALKFVDFKEAVAFAKKAIEYASRSNSKINEANAYNIIGICNHLQTNYKEAFENYSKALDIFIQLKNTHGLTSTYINIGILYSDRKELENSLRYFHKAEKTAVGEKEQVNLSSIYNNIGSVFQTMNQLDSAVFYYKAGLEIRKKRKNPGLIATSLANIGTVYFDKKEYEKALEYHLLALHYDSLAQDQSRMAMTFSNLGSSYLSVKNYSKAIECTSSAQKLAQQLNYVQQMPAIYRNFIDIYTEQKQYKKALEYAEKYIEVKYSLNNEETERIVSDMQAKYDSELKESEIKVLNSENEIKQTKIEQQTRFGYFMAVVMLLLLVLAFIAYRAYVHKKQTNRVISTQYKELVVQKKEIQEQKDEIGRKNDLLAEVLREIQQSIDYAQHIQAAILPAPGTIQALLPHSFVLFMPRNVVSGDFYYFAQPDPTTCMLCVADCTGHGVPGALMSMIGNEQLNKIVNEKGIHQPGEVLNQLHEGIRSTLQQEHNQSRDGMDLIFCKLDLQQRRVEYAGANRNLWVLTKEGENWTVVECSTNRQPVGGRETAERTAFETHAYAAKKGDRFFLFSDGFADQFGGSHAKKFMVKRLRLLLLELASLPIEEQGRQMHQEFLRWKGNEEQTDDVCMIGFEIH